MDPADIESWLADPESERLEFKEARRQFDMTKLCKYCVALANEGGGTLVLGVTDRVPRKVVGTRACNDPGGMQAKLLQRLGFRVDIHEVHHRDGRVVVLVIPPRPKGMPRQYDGAYYMRSGSELVPMTPDVLRGIFDEGKEHVVNRVAAAGVSAEKLVQILDTHRYFELLETPYPSDRAGVLERFSRERLIQQDGDGTYAVSNLAALLFARDVVADFDELARRAPRVVVYKGKSKLVSSIDRTATRGYAAGFTELIDFVNTQLPANEEIGRALRRNVRMFPEVAVRELVANALIHQDLEASGMSPMIEIYSDRIEISNPGPPAVEPIRFIDEYRSRNEQLADLMRRLGICEEKGTGIDRVVSAVEAYQLPAPEFRDTGNRTLAVLYRSTGFKNMSRKDRVRACWTKPLSRRRSDSGAPLPVKSSERTAVSS